MPNNIPSIRAAGKYVVSGPYDKVVDPSVFYTAEAIRTLPEMQALKLNLFELVFQPVGYDQAGADAEISKAIADGAVVVALTSRGRAPVYVLSTYIVSFPVANGVIYERLGVTVDLGPCPPSMKDRINTLVEHINEYVKGAFGIENPNATIGTVPIRGYVSKDTAEAWEKSRQLRITQEPSDTVQVEMLKKENAELKIYIASLEEIVKNKS